MFLASKKEDTQPIKMSKILKDVAHGRFKEEDIMAMEIDILESLAFKLELNSIYKES